MMANCRVAGGSIIMTLLLLLTSHSIWQGSVIMTVMAFLLGGGNSFSSGGPGKGMHR